MPCAIEMISFMKTRIINEVFWPRAKLKGPKRSFVVVGREPFWNEQKMFLEQKYGIELLCVALYGFV